MTNKNLIEQVRELNEKRTKTDFYMPYCTCGGDSMGGLEFDRYKDITEADENFIALAPQMAELCLEQHRQLQIAREALQNIDYHADLLNEVSTAPDFSPEEKYMQLGNLLQACADAGKALREMEGGDE